jgi:hypothetical protein
VGRIPGLEREIEHRSSELAAARAALGQLKAEIQERDQAMAELREVVFLAQQALLGVDEIKTRHPSELVTEKTAPLLSHSLAQLTWAIASQDRTLRAAMLLNLRTIATAFHNVPHFPILLVAIERLEPRLSELEAELQRSDLLGDGYYFFQRALQAVYSQRVNLLPFRYGVDPDGKVLQID